MFGLFACLFCALPLLAAQDVEVPILDAAKVVYTDPGSPNRKCTAASILTDTGTLFSAESPEVEPGIYRVHARLKASHTISKHTARLEFSLTANGKTANSQKKLVISDFELPGEYQDFSFPLVIARQKSWVAVSASWSWQGSVLQKRPPEPVKLPTVSTEASLEETTEEAEPLEHQLKELPYHLATDRVWLERLGDVAIRDLAVDKVRYYPGETAQITGAVVSYAATRRELQFAIALVRGMDEVQEVETRPMAVEPMNSAQFSAQATLDERLWGHEVRCVVREAGRELASASEYFTVHRNPWAVAIGGTTMDMTIYRAGPDGRNAEGNALSRKRHYVNQVEFVFWAPDDFGDLTPDGEYWSGQMRRHNSPESTKWLIDAFHRAGISCAFYAKIMEPGGKAGYEVLRQHPEWLMPVFYDVAQLDRWDRSTEMSCWPQLTVRRDIPDPYAHHAEEIIRSVKMFGWDMVRYDSGMTDPESGDVLRLVKRTVNRACPGFQWGYNTGLHRTENPPPPSSGKWDSDPNAEWNKLPLKPVFDILCEDGGMIMDEWNNHAATDGWTYESYAGRHVNIRKQAHSRGGHVVLCSFEPESHADGIYQEILPLAARTHRGWDPLKGGRAGANYEQFATRYAGYVWDNEAVELEKAEQWIDWGESAKFLFKWPSYSYLQKNGKAGSDLILQMVNMPPERVCSYDDCRVPPPRRDLKCSIRLPEGLKVNEVWRATAEPELKQEKLPHKVVDGQLVFTVPKLRFWNMVVVRLDGEGKWGIR